MKFKHQERPSSNDWLEKPLLLGVEAIEKGSLLVALDHGWQTYLNRKSFFCINMLMNNYNFVRLKFKHPRKDLVAMIGLILKITYFMILNQGSTYTGVCKIGISISPEKLVAMIGLKNQ